MKIAFLTNQYPTVSHTFIRREISALETLGYSVIRISIGGRDSALVDPADSAERSKTHYIKSQSKWALLACLFHECFRNPICFAQTFSLALKLGLNSRKPFYYHIFYFVEACFARTLLQAEGAQHLHCHFGTNSADVALLTHSLCGIPWSFTVHGPEEFDYAHGLNLPKKIQSAEFVVAISSYGRSQLFRIVDFKNWPKIKVVHCGIDEVFAAAPTAAPNETARFVCVGRLCEQKGQLLLISALQKIIQQGRVIELVLVGDGDKRLEIETLIQRNHLSSYVRITGWLSNQEVRKEIEQARALVLPSFAEGLPLVLMEAMVLGRPVISTYIAGIPELVRNDVDGWLVPAGDASMLAAAMISCLDAGPERLQKIGVAARERVLARHNSLSEARLLGSLFEEASRAR